jgi:hypothetical protein
MSVKEEMFRYVFKRALAEVDELLNLDPANDLVREARVKLLMARGPAEVDIARDVMQRYAPAMQALASTPSEARPAPQVSEKFQESLSEKPLQSSDNDIILVLAGDTIQEMRPRPGPDPVQTTPRMDYTGNWITRGGQDATVTGRRSDGAFDGFIKGVGAAVWNEKGNDESGNTKQDLTIRVRAGKFYK